MSLFKTTKNKRFNYKPIYFDPEKEERKKRREKKRISFRGEDSEFKRKNFDNWDRKYYSDMRYQGRRRMLVLIAITAAFLIACYFAWLKLIPVFEKFMIE